MNRLINTSRLAALALLGGAIFATAQPQTDATTPSATPRIGVVSRPERASVETRLQQIVAAQFAKVMTEEQRNHYREALEANSAKNAELEAKIREARKEMFALQLAEKFDDAAFRAQAETAANLQAEKELLNAQAFAKVRPSLTIEQIDKIKNQPFMNRTYGGPEARPGVFPAGVPTISQIQNQPNPPAPTPAAEK